MHDSLTVVLPVYRNAPLLPELVKRLSSSLLGIDYTLVFVVDASPDNSLDVLRMLAHQYPRMIILSLAQNVGQNRAVMIGLQQVTTDYALVMDADLQDPPEAIPALLTAIPKDADALFAGRRGSYESGARLLTSFLFKRLLWLLTVGRVPADAGLFVLMRRSMVERLLAFGHPEPYVIGLMARTGLPMVSIPVARAGNSLGVTGYTLRKRLKLAWLAFRTMTGPIHPAGPDAMPAVEVFQTSMPNDG